MHSDDLFYDRCIFFSLGLIYPIVHIGTGDRFVRRNSYHIQLVDIPKLSGFRFCRSGHTCQFMVHTEIILERNGCKRLSSSFHFYPFFCLYGLVKPVGITASFHNTSGLFINNLYFIIDNDIFRIPFEKCISFQQLINRMYPLGFYSIILHQLVFFDLLLLRGKTLVLQSRKLRSNIRQHEELGIIGIPGNHIESFIGKLYTVVLFINNEIQRLRCLRHIAVIFRHIISFSFQ